MRTYLIDGYNLGHKIPQVKQFLNQRDFAAAIEMIIQVVKQRLNTRKNRVIIVFDGKKEFLNSRLSPPPLRLNFPASRRKRTM